MNTFTSSQLQTVSNLSKEFGFSIDLIQPNAIGGTIDKLIKPIDYLPRALSGTGIKMTTNIIDRCICLYV